MRREEQKPSSTKPQTCYEEEATGDEDAVDNLGMLSVVMTMLGTTTSDRNTIDLIKVKYYLWVNKLRATLQNLPTSRTDFGGNKSFRSVSVSISTRNVQRELIIPFNVVEFY
jgi:hypothetical protein